MFIHLLCVKRCAGARHKMGVKQSRQGSLLLPGSPCHVSQAPPGAGKPPPKVRWGRGRQVFTLHRGQDQEPGSPSARTSPPSGPLTWACPDPQTQLFWSPSPWAPPGLSFPTRPEGRCTVQLAQGTQTHSATCKASPSASLGLGLPSGPHRAVTAQSPARTN